MKPEEIEQMKRDREAGTPGAWHWDDQFDSLTGVFSVECSQNHGFLYWDCSLDGPDPAHRNMDRVPVEPIANARRIARVPTLEAEVLRLREALGKIACNKTYADDPWSIARATLNGDAP